MHGILISKVNVDYGATAGTADYSWQAYALTDGALCAFRGDTGAKLTAVIPSAVPYIELMVGKGDDEVVRSPRVYMNKFSVIKNPYVAPVAKIMAIGNNVNGGTTYDLNLVTTKVAGTNAIVYLYDLEKPHENISRESVYTYTCIGGETDKQVCEGLIAKINADADRVATASLTTTSEDGIILTGVTAGNNFSAATGGILKDADVLEYTNVVRAGSAGVSTGYVSGLTDTVVAHNKGHGTYAQVLALEKDYSTEKGNTNPFLYSDVMYTEPFRAVSGTTYVVYALKWVSPNDNVLMPKNNFEQILLIAVPSGETGSGEAIAVLDTIFGFAGSESVPTIGTTSYPSKGDQGDQGDQGA